jgi:uncharacterized membrane protein
MLTNDTRGTTAYSLFAACVFVTIFFLIIRALRAALSSQDRRRLSSQKAKLAKNSLFV